MLFLSGFLATYKVLESNENFSHPASEYWLVPTVKPIVLANVSPVIKSAAMISP